MSRSRNCQESRKLDHERRSIIARRQLIEDAVRRELSDSDIFDRVSIPVRERPVLKLDPIIIEARSSGSTVIVELFGKTAHARRLVS